jgi:hypothetical protein
LIEDDRAFAWMKEASESAGKWAIKKASERKIANAGSRLISAAIHRVSLALRGRRRIDRIAGFDDKDASSNEGYPSR